MKANGDKDSEDTENAAWATDKMWKWVRGCSKVWIKRETGSHKYIESKMELFRWSISYQLAMHSCQIRGTDSAQEKRSESTEVNRGERENNFQRHLLKEKQFTLKGHHWLFMLYTGKGTLLKQGVLREKQNSIAIFLTILKT